MNSTGIGEKCAPALFLFAVWSPLIASGILAHDCMASFCFNTLLSCDIMLPVLQVFWTEQTTHRNYFYIRATEHHVGHWFKVEYYVDMYYRVLSFFSEKRRIPLFRSATPTNDLDVKSVIALERANTGKVIMIEDSFYVVTLLLNHKSRTSLWMEST